MRQTRVGGALPVRGSLRPVSTLKRFQPQLAYRWVLFVWTTPPVWLISATKGVYYSDTLSLLPEEILLFAAIDATHFTVEFVPGKLYAMAVRFSRLGRILPTAWSLSHTVLRTLWQRWGRALIALVLFATLYMTRLSPCVPSRDTQAYARIAFSLL